MCAQLTAEENTHLGIKMLCRVLKTGVIVTFNEIVDIMPGFGENKIRVIIRYGLSNGYIGQGEKIKSGDTRFSMISYYRTSKELDLISTSYRSEPDAYRHWQDEALFGHVEPVSKTNLPSRVFRQSMDLGD